MLASSKYGYIRTIKFALPHILIALIVLLHLYYSFTFVSEIDDYISDECWYVSSARNLLIKAFNIMPRYVTADGLLGLNIELSDLSARSNVIRTILGYGGRVVKSDYSLTQLIYVEVPGHLDTRELLEIPGVKSVIPGFRYPDYSSITSYLNTEHPPFTKYFIALSIALCGDRPICWRLPSLIASSITLVLTYLIIRSIINGLTGSYLGVVASLLLALDNLFRSMSMVAMIDMTLALFTTLTLCLIIKGRLLAGLISLNLAFISKYSGLFVAPIYLMISISRGMRPINVISYVALSPLLALVISSIPLIILQGFGQWWYEAVENAIRWHLSVKTLSGPPTAAPWEWLLGVNPFILHYRYIDGAWVADMVAKGNNIIYLIVATTSLITLPAINKLVDGGIISKFTWTTFLMYVFIWFLGSRTQYSFYMVQLVPSIYALLMIYVYWLTSKENINYLIKRWLELLNMIARWLSGEVRVCLHVELKERSEK